MRHEERLLEELRRELRGLSTTQALARLLREGLLDLRRAGEAAIRRDVARRTARGEKEMLCDGRNGLRLLLLLREGAGHHLPKQRKPVTMKSDIQIRNSADVCYIDIEGTIGVPEQWQFASPDDRVATYEKVPRRGGAHRSARRPAGGGQHPLDGRRRERRAADLRRAGGARRRSDHPLLRLRSLGRDAHRTGRIGRTARNLGRGALPGARGGLRRRGQRRRAGSPRRTAPARPTNGWPPSTPDGRDARRKKFAQRMAENNGNGRWLARRDRRGGAGRPDRRGRRNGRRRTVGRAGTSRAAGTGCWRRSVCTARRLRRRGAGGRPPQHPPPRRRGSGRRPFRRSKPPKGSGATVRRRCLRPKTRRSAKSAARPTKRPMPPTRGKVQDGDITEVVSRKNRREDLPPNSCSAFGSSQKHKKKGMKSILISFTLGKFRSFDSAFPARSRFTTFCHQRWRQKCPQSEKLRGPAPETLRGQARAPFSTVHPPPVLLPAFSQWELVLLRATMIICWCLILQSFGLPECTASAIFAVRSRRPEAC